MPRPFRIQDAGYVHHVICRGNDRQVLFKTTHDFLKYFDLIQEAKKLYPIEIYNFALMDNHIHLLLEPTTEGNLSKFMEHISKNYAKYFNKSYNHTGHVFQGRFKSFLVQEERYFLACSRYIDLNPVRANIVSDPKDYAWSGYNFVGQGREVGIKLDLHELYLRLGANSQERQIAYRALVLNTYGEELNLLDRRVCVLGSKEFKSALKAR